MTQRDDWLRSDAHLRNCPLRSRKWAVGALVGSAVIAASGVHGIGRPFPVEQDPAYSQFALAVVNAMLLGLFFSRFRCRHERLLIAVVLAGGLLLLLDAFLPGFGGPAAVVINVVCTTLWAAVAVISIGLVKSAFTAPRLEDARSRCPACGSPLARRSVKLASPFRCPACSAELRVPRAHLWWSAMVGLVVATGIAVLLGPATWLFTLVLVVAWFPASLGVAALTRALLPPQAVPHNRRGPPTDQQSDHPAT